MAYDFNSLTKQADEANNRDKFYTDFSDVDPNKLHQISELTEWMRTKAKGSDVREIIAQLFERTWLEGTKEGNANLEVAKARGAFETLSERLNTGDIKTRDFFDEIRKSLTSPFTLKGTVKTKADLPSNASQNDTYYVSGEQTRYTFNGTTWFQSSLNEGEYSDELSSAKRAALQNIPLNIFDKKTITERAASTHKAPEGDTSLTMHFMSDFIEVAPNTDYTVSAEIEVVATEFDEKKNYIGELNRRGDERKNFSTVTTSANARYIRVNGAMNDGEFGDYATSDELCVNIGKLSNYELRLPIPEAYFLNSLPMLLKHLEQLTPINIFDKKTITERAASTYKVPEGDTSLTMHFMSDFIEVAPNTDYTVSAEIEVVATEFDEKKNYIGYLGRRDDERKNFTTVTTSSKTRYIRVNGAMNDGEFGDYATSDELCVNIGKLSKYELADSEAFLKRPPYAGKKLLCIGDSITDLGVYTDPLAEILEVATLYNRGVSGTTWAGTHATSFVSRADLPPNDEPLAKSSGFPAKADIITVLGGVNDWGKSWSSEQPFGRVTDAPSKNSFCGAVHYLFQKLRSKYPDALIVSLINYRVYAPELFPNWSEIAYNSVNDENSGFSFRANSKGKTLEDYRQAVVEISSMYGIKCIDLREAGFSFFRKADRQKYAYYQNGYHDGLHPNEEGGRKMAEYIVAQLKCLLGI